MQLHEYQAKEILKENNVPVPEGKIATTSKASEEIAISLGGKCVLLKRKSMLAEEVKQAALK